MGALYTSQFMHPTIKARVKPTVEIMAALPSVVVGFIAGLWLASRVEREIVPVLLMIVLLPLFGHRWASSLWEPPAPRRSATGLRPGMEIAVILPLLLLGAAGGPRASARGSRRRSSRATSGSGSTAP